MLSETAEISRSIHAASDSVELRPLTEDMVAYWGRQSKQGDFPPGEVTFAGGRVCRNMDQRSDFRGVEKGDTS